MGFFRRFIWMVIPVIALSPVLAGCFDRTFATDKAAPDFTAIQAHDPQLITDNTVAADLKTLADETWSKFLVVFHDRENCFRDVHLHALTNLDSRAAYDPDTATVTIRVPATRVMLQGGLIHEWAHHIEFQCAAHLDLRTPFLVAQGLPTDTPWRTEYTPTNTPESEWAVIPSEQYAEATIELVLGRRQIPTTVRVSVEAVQVIAEWASGH
jgi:hypothetical protein